MREGHAKSAPSWRKNSNEQYVSVVFVAGTSCKIRPFEVLGEGGMAGLDLGVLFIRYGQHDMLWQLSVSRSAIYRYRCLLFLRF